MACRSCARAWRSWASAKTLQTALHGQSHSNTPATVGELLHNLMAANKWRGAARWREQANTIAPASLVGSSKKHGGPDLRPTRAKRAWAALGVDGMGIWDDVPGP